VIMFRSGIIPEVEAVPEGFGSPWMIGEMLFNEFLLPFEVTSIVLLVAMIGAIIITQRRIQVERRTGQRLL
jgi:NADH:ubiquinone oxidoreductase subunit 6 (subunit J)